MRRRLILEAMFLLVLLAACERKELDYDDFSERLVSTYFAAEHASNNRYIVYYFDSTDNESDTLKKEVLTLFDTFETLEFYLLDTADTGSEQSLFGGYDDRPILHVISEDQVLETRVGGDEIRALLRDYASLSYDYDLFADQHVTSIHDLYQAEQGDVLVYYYDPADPVDESFLRWAFTKPVQRVRFVNRTEVEEPDQFPSELYRLEEEGPALFLMSDDQYANEMYQDITAIASYIETVGTGSIVAMWRELEYSMFSDHALVDITNSLELEEGIYFLYFYSIYCSHCNSIKSDILAFFQSMTDYPWYISDLSSASGSMPIADFVGVPALYIIQDGTIHSSYIGSAAIPNFLSHYRQGNISFD